MKDMVAKALDELNKAVVTECVLADAYSRLHQDGAREASVLYDCFVMARHRVECASAELRAVFSDMHREQIEKANSVVAPSFAKTE